MSRKKLYCILTVIILPKGFNIHFGFQFCLELLFFAIYVLYFQCISVTVVLVIDTVYKEQRLPVFKVFFSTT